MLLAGAVFLRNSPGGVRMQSSGQHIDRQSGEDRLDRLYVSYYNLVENPFKSGKDPRFFWLGEKQLEALAYLKLGVEQDKGILVLTGEEGSGKSVLLDCLLRVVDCEIIPALFQNPGATVRDFLNFLTETFRLGDSAGSKGDVLARLQKFLRHNFEKNRKVLLILKNAHALKQEIIEQARLLSNIESEATKLLAILFVGDDRFLDILSQPVNRALLQRVAIRCRLDPLSEDETAAYIGHRIKTAGGVRELFTPGAIREIAALTEGNPGLINIVCDHALMQGYFDRLGTIDEKVIQRYARDTKHLLGGDRKGLAEYKVRPTATVSGKTKKRRSWLWVIIILAAVLVPILFQTAPSMLDSFRLTSRQMPEQMIYFESNATALPSGTGIVLDKVVAYLMENPAARIRVIGHSDNVGERETNIRISTRRATMVKDYLVAKGADPG